MAFFQGHQGTRGQLRQSLGHLAAAALQGSSARERWINDGMILDVFWMLKSSSFFCCTMLGIATALTLECVKA
jgi:hypothetical protein